MNLLKMSSPNMTQILSSILRYHQGTKPHPSSSVLYPTEIPRFQLINHHPPPNLVWQNGRHPALLPTMEQLPEQHHVGVRESARRRGLRRRHTRLRRTQPEGASRRSVGVQSVFSGTVEGEIFTLVYMFFLIPITNGNTKALY